MAEEYIKRSDLPKKRIWKVFIEQGYFNEGWNACLEEISKIKSADVRELKEAEWIIQKDEFGTVAQCPVCKSKGMLWGNYCCICGTKMKQNNY